MQGGWMKASGRGAARVSGPAFLDEGCVLEQGSTIGSGVYVGRGAKLGAGAGVNRSCVLEETQVAAGELVEDSIAWRTHRISGL